MSASSSFSIRADNYRNLVQFKKRLQRTIDTPNPVGLKEVCANVLWQVDHCEPVSKYNMDIEVMRKLSEAQIIQFSALCETANQLKNQERKSFRIQKTG